MGIFGFGKKKEETAEVSTANILILGGGCAMCNELEEVTKVAMEELGWDEEVGHITDFSVIATYGVMSTPALVVDGVVVSMGKVLKKQEAIEILKKARA